MKPTLVFRPLGGREVGGLADVAEVVRDRLLAEHVLAGLERGHVDLEVLGVPGHHVDDGDVVAGKQVA